MQPPPAPGPTISQVKTALPAEPQPQPFPPPATPTPTQTPPAAPPPDAHPNISSEAVDQPEVDKIAAELRQQLDKTKDSEQTEKDKQPGEGTLNLQPGQGDTIFIDRDGQFHQNESTPNPPPK
jgi:hypothetical protein